MLRNASMSLALAVAVTTSACAHASPPARIIMGTAAIGMVVMGGAVASTDDHQTSWGNPDGGYSGPEEEGNGMGLVGLVMVGTGVVLGIAALMGGTDHGHAPEPATAAPVAPVRMDGPPGGDGTSAAAPLPRGERPLPEVATDARTLQLAKQVRSAALRGDCEGASLTLAAIHERDPRYYAALMSSSVIAGCR